MEQSSGISRRALIGAGVAAAVVLRQPVVADAKAKPKPWPLFDFTADPGVSVIGSSVLGRPIHVVRRTGVAATVSVVLVGSIHGTEPLGTPVAAKLAHPDTALPDWLDLHLIPLANPDGYSTRRRHNGAKVDLNRDGAWNWKKKPRDGGPPGKFPESQPETLAVLGYVRAMTPAPALTIWVHQGLGWCAPVTSGGPAPAQALAASDAYRRVSRLKKRRFGQVGQSGGWETTAAADVGPAVLVDGSGFQWPSAKTLDRHVAAFFAACNTLAH